MSSYDPPRSGLYGFGLRNAYLGWIVVYSMRFMPNREPRNSDLAILLESIASDVAGLRTDVASVRTEQASLRAELTAGLRNTNLRINALSADVAELSAGLDAHVSSLQLAIRAIDGRLTDHLRAHD